MQVYRLCRKKFATPFNGKGAAIKGARWNSIGVEIIYTAANRSLAMAEVAVHFSLGTLPSDYIMMEIFIPDNISLKKLNVADLPSDWNLFPYSSKSQQTGDQFVLENKYCVLQIPSAVTAGDFNILINPNHPQFPKIKVVDTYAFPFDKRIFKQ